ncbi:unnamed protein product [Psylliodes chrysocephalus]|uniref:Vps16 C-terminal domain-containing protein n=1 Tax=Psylliodes chrysocephalus TaxID=3402493 RepID=A0A9P0CSS2_9CUCU|nr:unnamed protein product [Psylliodes chrysocephala]
MTAKSSEDFWNTSSSSAFNFDDDEDDGSQPEYVFTSIPEENSILSIHSIISKTSLNLILDDLKSTNEYVAPPVEEVILKMLTGQKYSLEVYKKFTDKLVLLDSALESMDGDIILNVILFLKSTLRPNIFFHQLAKRKLAVKHYAIHLIVNNHYSEVADLYMRTGLNSNMKQLYYLIGRDIRNKESLLKRLETFTAEHLQKVNNNDDKLEILENSQLLKWQVEKNENCDSIIEQLAVLCKNEFEKNKNSIEILLDFKKRLKIDDFAFEWTVLNVLASMELWPQLTELFVKPNWLTKKNSLKTVMPAEIFVYGLSRHESPKEILELYLPYISDSERGLYLAQKMNCHKFVIQHYIKERDRLALIQYKSKVSPQDEEYFLIKNALLSNDKKWKN